MSLIPGPVIDHKAAVSIAGKLYLLVVEKKSIILLSYKKGVWSLILVVAATQLGLFVYVAGGFGVGGESLSSVTCFDTDRMVWEALPNMTTKRDTCSGFVIDGKFYVIGGFRVSLPTVDDMEEFSTEVYDPKTGTWTLLEGMWAESLRWHARSEDRRRPVVAVVGNTLYALERCRSDAKEKEDSKLTQYQ